MEKFLIKWHDGKENDASKVRGFVTMVGVDFGEGDELLSSVKSSNYATGDDGKCFPSEWKVYSRFWM